MLLTSIIEKKISITGVTDIESFNEEVILLILKNGGLIIKGEGLHVQKWTWMKEWSLFQVL